MLSEGVDVGRRVIGGRHVDHAVPFEAALDAVPVDGCFDLVQVLQPEFFEHLEFVGVSRHAVADAVRQRRLHESAVAPAGRAADFAHVDQHDVAGGIALLGDEGGPQPGVPAADDAEICVLVSHERRVRLRAVGALEPEGSRFGVGDRVERAARGSGC